MRWGLELRNRNKLCTVWRTEQKGNIIVCEVDVCTCS